MGGIAPVYVSKIVGGEKTWGLERPELPRPVKKNQLFMVKRNKVLAVPTHRLNNKASQIKHAPRSLIEEHKRPLKPALDTRPVPPKTLLPPSKAPNALVLKQPRASLSTTSVQIHAPRPPLKSKASKPLINTAAPKGNADSGSLARQGKAKQPTPISSSPANSSDRESPKDTSPLPPRIRKRPPPNVFIQQAKRKKIA
jgi:elongin-A